MRRWVGAASPVALAVLLLFGGCDDGNGNGGGGGVAGGPPPPPGGRGPDGGGPGAPEIKRIMVALAKGPNSLTPLLGNELKEEQPPWATIQGQAKEYARLAAELGNYEPQRGSKESWSKLTADYAGSAASLDTAAQAKDKAAALTAHDQLKNSCNACHQLHRRMGPGRGGPPGGPGGPPGGPPPGGPGGGPPPQ